MKKLILLSILSGIIFFSGCVAAPKFVSSDPFTGTVIDARTGQTVEGVLVVGEFY